MIELVPASIHTFIPNSPVCNLGVIFDQNLSFSRSHHSAFPLLLHAYPRPSKNPPYAPSQNGVYHRYSYSPRKIRLLEFSFPEHRRHSSRPKPTPNYSECSRRVVTKI